MKYLIMLVISLGLVACGGSSSDSDAGEKWAEFNKSRVGVYSTNKMSYNVDKDSRTITLGGSIIAPQTEEEIEKHREEATDITGNSYCFTREDYSGIEIKTCRYIDSADSYFEEIERLLSTPTLKEYVEINSVNGRSTFLWAPSSSTIKIAATNRANSKTDEGDELGAKSIVGEWTFKTYTFNDNKLISLKSITLDTCTATECTEINLTGLTYEELTQNEDKANTWSGSQDKKTAEVVMSPDQKQLSIMICKDFKEIKSITECSFIAGTIKE